VGSQTVGGISYSSGTLGTAQNDQMQGHTHTDRWLVNGGAGTVGYSGISGTLGNSATVSNPINDGANGNPRTGTETRPVNLTVKYCIKY
jgi:hypothetical protein